MKKIGLMIKYTIIGLLIICISSYVLCEYRSYKIVTHAIKLESFDRFVENGINLYKLSITKNDDDNFFVWESSVPHMGSGRTIYIFDKHGKLFDYTRDIGDDIRFKEQWPSLNKYKTISVAEVVDLIENE